MQRVARAERTTDLPDSSKDSSARTTAAILGCAAVLICLVAVHVIATVCIKCRKRKAARSAAADDLSPKMPVAAPSTSGEVRMEAAAAAVPQGVLMHSNPAAACEKGEVRCGGGPFLHIASPPTKRTSYSSRLVAPGDGSDGGASPRATAIKHSATASVSSGSPPELFSTAPDSQDVTAEDASASYSSLQYSSLAQLSNAILGVSRRSSGAAPIEARLGSEETEMADIYNGSSRLDVGSEHVSGSGSCPPSSSRA